MASAIAIGIDQEGSTATARVGLPHVNRGKPWFLVDDLAPVTPVIVNRTPRYRDRSRFLWKAAMRAYGDRGAFVGHSDEREAFKKEVGPIDWIQTDDYLALAPVIAGSKLFIDNQSAAAWVVLGLNHPIWIEQRGNRQDDCHFKRPHAFYDNNQLPPDLDRLPVYDYTKLDR